MAERIPSASSSFARDAWRVSVAGKSALCEATSSIGLEPPPTVSLEAAIETVGGSHTWWWGGWLSLGHYFWVVRDPAANWSSGSTFLTGNDERAAVTSLAHTYELREQQLDYDIEVDLMQILGSAMVPPPLADALSGVDVGIVSLVVAGNVTGMIPIATLTIPGTDDVRVIERAVVRVQPPAFLSALVAARDCDPFGPWPLAVACLDPRGDLEHARQPELVAEHILTATALVAERGQPSVPASREALANALKAVGRGANALLFYSGHVDPGAVGGDLTAHLVLDSGDALTAADLFGLGEQPVCVPNRVILSACDSGGAHGSGGGEWFGLGAAMLVAGARQVIATAWPIADSAFTASFDRLLVNGAREAVDLARVLRDAQLQALEAWRSRRYEDASPVDWAAYQTIGVLA